jgi:hypothetical protein
MQQLPLTCVMLWGVVAVEFQEANAARETLGAYLEATQGRPAGAAHAAAHAQMVLRQLRICFVAKSPSQQCSP